MKLSDRIYNDSDAALWVIDEIVKLENKVERLQSAANFAANAADGFRAEADALRADAERYRWLAWTSDTNPIMPYCPSLNRLYYGREADAAIDAARGES